MVRKCLTPYAACAKAKEKQKSLPSGKEIVRVEKNPKEVSGRVNKRIYLEISSIKAPKDMKGSVSKPNW